MNKHSGSAPLLELNDLRVRLHSKAGIVHAVEGVSLRLEQGKTLGIVGESGSGKSVLARSIMNLMPRRATALKSGQVLLQGRNLLPLSEAELRPLRGPAMAMIFQDPMTALNPVLRLSVQLTEPLRLHLHLDRQQARAKAVELLQAVGIPDATARIDQYPHQLSGGMRQRVVIAIALACSPLLLIADEPTTALDVTVQKQILDLLSELQRKHDMGMILITHDLGVVATRADHIAVMYAGRVVEQAPTRELFSNHQHPYTEALLKSIPRLSDPSHTRLQAIPGRPPQLVNPPTGCSFAPRCQYAQDRCHAQTPPTVQLAQKDHAHACFYPIRLHAIADREAG